MWSSVTTRHHREMQAFKPKGTATQALVTTASAHKTQGLLGIIPVMDPTKAAVVAGVVSGVAQTAVGHPFDTVKVRLQTCQNGYGTFKVMSTLFKTEGLRGFYRGISTPLLGVGAMNSLMFSSYSIVQSQLNSMGWEAGPKRDAASGAVAGFVSSFLLTPIDYFKCNRQVLQSQACATGGTDIQLVLHTMRTRPIEMFRGLGATSMFLAVGGAAFFTTFNIVRAKFAELRGGEISALDNAVAGALAGLGFLSTAYPLDLIKTRVQTGSSSGISSALSSVLSTRGVPGLYRGFNASVARALPVDAVLFVVYHAVFTALTGELSR
eukprot:Clim_evm23s70 gene=Clim_evmTU23s70